MLMSFNSVFRAAAIGWIVLIASSMNAQDSPPAAAPEKKLSTEERVRLIELPRAFAAARDDLDRKEQVVQEALDLGPFAVQRLRPIVEKEWNAAAAAYQKMFLQELRKIKPEDLEKTEPEHLVQANDRMPPLRDKVLRLAAMTDQLAEAPKPTDPKTEETTNEPPRTPLVEVVERGERAAVIEARNAVAMMQLDREEVVAIQETNRQRLAHGLWPLQVDPKLCLVAADHSHDMQKLDFFSHTSPVPGKESFTDRAGRFGASASAENIARNSGSGEGAVKMWMESEGHRANLLNPQQRRLGIGRAGGYFTQLFGR